MMAPPLAAPGQGDSGSWNDSVHDTIRQLYARWKDQDGLRFRASEGPEVEYSD